MRTSRHLSWSKGCGLPLAFLLGALSVGELNLIGHGGARLKTTWVVKLQAVGTLKSFRPSEKRTPDRSSHSLWNKHLLGPNTGCSVFGLCDRIVTMLGDPVGALTPGLDSPPGTVSCIEVNPWESEGTRIVFMLLSVGLQIGARIARDPFLAVSRQAMAKPTSEIMPPSVVEQQKEQTQLHGSTSYTHSLYTAFSREGHKVLLCPGHLPQANLNGSHKKLNRHPNTCALPGQGIHSGGPCPQPPGPAHLGVLYRFKFCVRSLDTVLETLDGFWLID